MTKSITKPIKVAAQSPAASVAGAIAGKLRDKEAVVLQAVGASAVNQAIKAAAIARSYLAEEGTDLFVVPDFTKVLIAGSVCTAIRLYIYERTDYERTDYERTDYERTDYERAGDMQANGALSAHGVD